MAPPFQAMPNRKSNSSSRTPAKEGKAFQLSTKPKISKQNQSRIKVDGFREMLDGRPEEFKHACLVVANLTLEEIEEESEVVYEEGDFYLISKSKAKDEQNQEAAAAANVANDYNDSDTSKTSAAANDPVNGNAVRSDDGSDHIKVAPNPTEVAGSFIPNNDRAVEARNNNDEASDSAEPAYVVPRAYLCYCREKLEGDLMAAETLLQEARKVQSENMKKLRRVPHYWEIFGVIELFLSSFLTLPSSEYPMKRAELEKMYKRAMVQMGDRSQHHPIDAIWDKFKKFQPHNGMVLQFSEDGVDVSLRFISDTKSYVSTTLNELRRQKSELSETKETLEMYLVCRRVRPESVSCQADDDPGYIAYHYMKTNEIVFLLNKVKEALRQNQLAYRQFARTVRDSEFWEVAGGLFVLRTIMFYGLGRHYALSMENVKQFYNDLMDKNAPSERDIPSFKKALDKAREIDIEPFKIELSTTETEVWIECHDWYLMEKETKQIRADVLNIERTISWLRDEHDLRDGDMM